MRWRNVLFFAIAVVFVPSLGHWLLSSYGFNPTDDGFVLAAARRVLSGQVPLRDFIWVRPAGSALLHIPEVLWGGAYTYWLSRWVVWLQFGAIAWAWTRIAETTLSLRLGTLERVATSLFALTLGLHSFPLMAWTSLDALF